VGRQAKTCRECGRAKDYCAEQQNDPEPSDRKRRGGLPSGAVRKPVSKRCGRKTEAEPEEQLRTQNGRHDTCGINEGPSHAAWAQKNENQSVCDGR
jgi:hypothetical protein